MKINFSRMAAQLVRRYGDKDALINIERNRRYTFCELHLLTNRIVNMMRHRLGLQRGTSYLCLLENDNLSLLHAWTVLKGDAAAAWTNFHDSYDEHLWQIDWIGPKVAFLETALIERYHEALNSRGITIVCMDPLLEPRENVHYFWDLLDGVAATDPDVENDAHKDILIYRFTGGTTGRGKCAQYTTDIWLACRDSFFADADGPHDDRTRALQMAPLSHGAALGVLPLFFRGGCLLTQNTPNLVEWCRNIEAERATMSTLVPTMLYRLLELEEAKAHDLSTLSTIYYGAAPISASKLAMLQERFGNIFIQVYGATECFQPVAKLGKADHLPGPDGDLGHLASAGRIAPGVEVIIADDDGNELPDGEVGEVWMRARTTISGYYRNPEGTAEEFHNGFWKSGDLGYRDEKGFLYIVDRKKDMIITGGFNVYAIEVEDAINSHPAVVMSAVVGIPHDQWGEAVHAEVILKPDVDASAEQLIEHVKQRLGKHKAPKSVSFVNTLPLSAAHKVLRRIVRDKYWTECARRVG
ncbi:AMP-binding protein [Sphingomonas cavernae]|uniref:Long-chain fatty acid--CoA ligase n=1 Tax=Sphingomonas cavernae TaxID=2320861 RepID=A0A418WQW4_9SPHN|nr:AMP-binding protein [Sphingomonas cavernae]RJF93632.1 long-chain fatty acid--CoA ligase [Sphingomonas cavernae]